MKKQILFVFIFLTLQPVKAQSWCPPGASWYPGVYSEVSGYDGYVEYKYTYDTLIQDKKCKVIKGTFVGRNWLDFAASHTVVPNYRTYYTYENNGTLCLFQDNSFDTVVNFKAQIGDKWRTLRCPNGSPGSVFTVTDTGHVIINNLSLRKVVQTHTAVVATGTGVQTYTHVSVFIERILGYSIDWEDLFNRSCFHVSHVGQGEVNKWPVYCGYRDNVISTVNDSDHVTCQKIPIIKKDSEETKEVSVFPNPSSGDFTLDIDEGSDLKIYNNLGSLIYEKPISASGSHSFDLRDLPKGIYHVKVQGNSGYKKCKIVKE